MSNSIDRNELSSATARTVDQASSSMHRAIDSASAMARPAVDNLAASAHSAVDKMASAATRAAESFDEKGGQLRDAQAQFTEACRCHVREKPMTSVGIALAAGFALSWLLRSRK